MPDLTGPIPLEADHSIDQFDCGVGSLDIWLQDHARAAAGAGSARTYVILAGEGRVVGYHALTVASVSHTEASARARRGMPKHPIPAVLLARLAVDKKFQGCGLGVRLLTDATRRAVAVADTAGIRLLLVHALNDSARTFYAKFGFQPSPTDPFNLQLLIKDIRQYLA